MQQEIRPPAIDFLDVSKTQLVTSTPMGQKKLDVDNINYLKACEDIWKTKTQLPSYQKGLFLGKGDRSNILFQEFIKKFRKTLEEIIREELRNNNQTSEAFKDDFKALEFIFNMLLNHLTMLNVEFKDEKFLAVLHGFFNSYIESIIKINNHAN